MPLNSEQRAATIREFQESMSRLGLTAERIGKDFGVSGSRVEQIITLKSGVLEYPWIIRAYLLSKAAAQGVELTPLTALRGNRTIIGSSTATLSTEAKSIKTD